MENKKRLCDTNALLQVIRTSYERMDSFVPDVKRRNMAKAALLSTIDLIGEIPTVDAVEVVRCKDCTHARKDIDEKGKGIFCAIWGRGWHRVEPDDFCSYGTRKDDGNG